MEAMGALVAAALFLGFVALAAQDFCRRTAWIFVSAAAVCIAPVILRLAMIVLGVAWP